MERHHPELSIITPVLNEEAGIDRLFAMLAEQLDTDFELVIVDGGSSDGTVERAGELAPKGPFPATVIEAGRGRGCQMNAGTRATGADTLLFLHADCLLPDAHALRTALNAIDAAISRRGDDRVAGHFLLRFERDDGAPSLPYAFYEAKARLHRPGCTHGDQGLLLRRRFFDEVGHFDASRPILEDMRIAAAIAARGEWLLLPAEIVTSARRFEVEGLRERQTLNAILMNFAHMGWDRFLDELPRLYRNQDRVGRLALGPILSGIDAMIRALPRHERSRLWHDTGRYVRANAWQIPFFLDVHRSFRRGEPLESVSGSLLEMHDRWFDRLTDNPAGRWMTAFLVWIWFRLTLATEMSRAKKQAGNSPRLP